MGHLYSSPRAQGSSGKKGWKDCKSQREQMFEAKQYWPDVAGLCAHELAAAGIACTGTAQDQARKNTRVKSQPSGGAWQPMAAGGRESVLFRVASLRGYLLFK